MSKPRIEVTPCPKDMVFDGLYIREGAIMGTDKEGRRFVVNDKQIYYAHDKKRGFGLAIIAWFHKEDLGIPLTGKNGEIGWIQKGLIGGPICNYIIGKYGNNDLTRLSGIHFKYEKKEVNYHAMNYNRNVPRKAHCKPRTRIG